MAVGRVPGPLGVDPSGSVVLTPGPLGTADNHGRAYRPGPLGAEEAERIAHRQNLEGDGGEAARDFAASHFDDEALKKYGLETIELRLITFIPMQRISDPLGVQYQADGPGFSYSRNEFRTRHTLVIDPSKLTAIDRSRPRVSGATSIDPGFVVQDERRTGLSISYVPTVSLPGARIPILHGEIQRDIAVAQSSMDWSLQRTGGRNFKLTMRGNATNPVAVTHLVGIVPAINYEIEFLFDENGSVTVDGEHDGFPAYNFYFQKRQFHHYDPIAAGRTPLSLFGPAPQIRLGERKLR